MFIKKFAKRLTLLFLVVALPFFYSGCCWLAEQELDNSETRNEPENGDGDYSLREIEYFLDIALGAEFGTSETVKRWPSGTIEFEMKGSPTTRDKIVVKGVMRELKQLTDRKIRFKEVEDEPDMVIWFVPVKDMSKYEPEYVVGNWGFFYVWWDENHEIYKTNILIGSDEPNQIQRNHLIREEVTQSLGLINDSWKYEESIFYQGWTEVQEYSDIDETLIQMLYSDVLRAGMTRKQAMDAFLKDGQ